MKGKIKNNINNIKEVISIRANHELMDIDYIDKEGERKTITDGDEFDVIYYIQHLQEEIERLTENNLSMQGEMARTWKKAEEKDKEIERLNKDLKDACEVIERLKEDKKKARERLMKANIYRNYDDEEDDTHYTDLNIEELLEILDKEK